MPQNLSLAPQPAKRPAFEVLVRCPATFGTCDNQPTGHYILEIPRQPSLHGRPLHAKRFFSFGFTGVDCSHTSGLRVRREVAGPDGICWLTPDHFCGLLKSPDGMRLGQPWSYL